IIAAAKWAGTLLKNPDDLLKGAPSLTLDAINDAIPEGKQLLASAKQILTNLNKPAAAAITIEDTSDTAKIFGQPELNGDGIVTADSSADDAPKAAITDIIACVGAETDRNGKPGVSQPKLDAFFEQAQAYSDWWKQAEKDNTVLPLDGGTANAILTFK